MLLKFNYISSDFFLILIKFVFLVLLNFYSFIVKFYQMVLYFFQVFFFMVYQINIHSLLFFFSTYQIFSFSFHFYFIANRIVRFYNHLFLMCYFLRSLLDSLIFLHFFSIVAVLCNLYFYKNLNIWLLGLNFSHINFLQKFYV